MRTVAGPRAAQVAEPPLPFDLAAVVETGLFDPDGPDAADVVDYLTWLAHDGHDVVALARLTALEHFGAVSSALALRPGTRPLAEHDGIDIPRERIDEIAAAFGFDRETVAAGRYTEGELRFLAAAHLGSTLFSDEETLYFAQVTGSAMARMAEAAVSLFITDIEAPLQDENLSRTELAERSKEATVNLEVLMDSLEPLFRTHMAQAILRLHLGGDQATSPLGVRQAIGFVDLVGFTSLSASLPMAELSVLIREFEAGARAIVAGCGAQVVKTVGDAVMITGIEADQVAEAASALLADFGGRSRVEARAGLTYGDVLVRGGDYYGPVVNLAARLGDLAVPGEILATIEFEAALTTARPFEPAGRRQLKGFAEPVATVSLLPGAT